MPRIRFGTEGWRAVLADQYTFENVRMVARATAAWLKTQDKTEPVAIGHDTRFMGDRFAKAVADELAAAGVKPLLCASFLPSPAICYYVASQGRAAGIVLTASHNSAEWNGYKVKGPEGGSALAEEAAWIGEEANRLLEQGAAEPTPEVEHKRFDVKEQYLERVLSLVDREAIAKAKLTVVADMMHGAGCGFFDEGLRRAGCAEVRTLRASPDPTFGWNHPEPIGPNLGPSIARTEPSEVDIGVATDGDADRFGMMAKGEYIDIQRAIVFILYHLLKNRGWRGRVMRSLNVTSMLDRLCDHYGCEVVETSIGFKSIGPEMITATDILLGVEESGGFGIRGHVPDRDGTVAALIACETLAAEGKPVGEILRDIYELVGGRRYFDRVDLRLEPEQRGAVDAALPSIEPRELAGKRVDAINGIDGAKFIRDDESWLLMRLSGTEPLVRVYAEGWSADDVAALLEAGRELVMKAAKG
jgi:phosphomannomutase